MRPLFLTLLLIATPVFAAGDTPVVDVSAAQQLAAARAEVARARAEVARAGAEEQRLSAQAAQAGSEAQRLAGEQRAALAGLQAAEARIAQAEAELTVARHAAAARRRRLAERQAPVAGLLAGLVSMGRRPPLLALADGSAEEFVRVRALLDTTLPAIRVRTAALSGELAAAQRSEAAARAARDRVASERAGLEEQRERFAVLEQRALSREAQLAGAALGAGDATLAGGETVAALDSQAGRQRAARTVARELIGLGPLPALPVTAGRVGGAPFAYRLPSDARVTAGLGSVNDNGVRSRGVSLASPRGAAVAVPAAGTVVFAGPYRRSDGVVIIDHGGGWMSLLVNVAPSVRKGERVELGAPLGRALGAVEVELSRRGTNVSPAFIAASSVMLSKAPKGS